MRPTVRNYILRLTVLIAVIIAYFTVPGVREFFWQAIAYLKHRDFEGLRLYILSFGMWAPLASICLMVVQAIIPVVPGIAITIANAWIFGWKYGALYSWLGALAGASLDFGAARWYGRPLAESFVCGKKIDKMDYFFNKYGIFAVFITRMTPVVPFKVVSYGAGLSNIHWSKFIMATGLGQLIPIILYSVLGQNITRNFHAIIIISSIIFISSIFVYCYRNKIEEGMFGKK